MGSPVVHFEVHATDRARLARFYEDVFGWKTMSAEGMPYTLLFPTGKGDPGQGQDEGIGGGMMDRRGAAPEVGAPVNGFTCIIQVDDLDAAHAKVLEHGGTETVAPMDIPGVGRVFYFRDPDENIVGVLRPA